MTAVVPEEIQTVIVQAQARAAEQAQAEAERCRKAEVERDAQRRWAWAQFVEQSLPRVPQFLRPYLITEDENGDRRLRLNIPGLALMYLYFDRQAVLYRVPGVWWNGRPSEDNQPYLNYHGNGYPTDHYKADAALAQAQQVQAQLEQCLAEWQEKTAQAEQAQQAEAERERRRAELEAARETAEAEEARQEEAEARELVNALRADPVAAALLKTFAALQAERAAVQGQIESLETGLSFTQERYDARISRLRNDLQDAQSASDAADGAARKIRQLERQIN